MKKATVYSKYNKASISTKKVIPVMNLVRGKDAMDAKIILAFQKSKAGGLLLKTLKSAIANAKNNLSLNVEDLYISDLQVNAGRTRKSGQFIGHGHFNPILKRSSHIILGLSKKEGVAKQ
jgi:large subunit ribosomal protein L22